MTERVQLPEPRPPAVPDFTRLDNMQAMQRVQELMRRGWSEQTVAALTGWGVDDVRRALAERGGPPP